MARRAPFMDRTQYEDDDDDGESVGAVVVVSSVLSIASTATTAAGTTPANLTFHSCKEFPPSNNTRETTITPTTTHIG